MALSKGQGVEVMLLETLGSFSPDFVGLLKGAASEVNNKQADSLAVRRGHMVHARTWLSFASQRISVALHTAVAWEVTTALDGRGRAVAGDPRAGGGSKPPPRSVSPSRLPLRVGVPPLRAASFRFGFFFLDDRGLGPD